MTLKAVATVSSMTRELPQKHYKLVKENAFTNKTILSGIQRDEDNNYVIKGNETEQAILGFFASKETLASCADQIATCGKEKVLENIEFTSSRKKSSIVLERPNE
jgi:magnesium-transporting ATPase (P-type)